MDMNPSYEMLRVPPCHSVPLPEDDIGCIICCSQTEAYPSSPSTTPRVFLVLFFRSVLMFCCLRRNVICGNYVSLCRQWYFKDIVQTSPIASIAVYMQ